MAIAIDYFFTLASHYSYMGHEWFEVIAAERGLAVTYKATNFGKVFPVSGGLPVKQRAPQRQAYRFMELKRWSDYLGLKLNLEPAFFPVNDGLAARVVMAALQDGAAPGRLMAAYLRAVWAEERDIADEETVAAIATENGFDGAKLLEAASMSAIQEACDGCTQEAIDRGVFGAPTWILNDELFWGQDRLDFLQRALDKARG